MNSSVVAQLTFVKMIRRNWGISHY